MLVGRVNYCIFYGTVSPPFFAQPLNAFVAAHVPLCAAFLEAVSALPSTLPPALVDAAAVYGVPLVPGTGPAWLPPSAAGYPDSDRLAGPSVSPVATLLPIEALHTVTRLLHVFHERLTREQPMGDGGAVPPPSAGPGPVWPAIDALLPELVTRLPPV